MGDFQEDNFEQKLLLLKDTQDSIQSLSVWCLKHQQQHKKVVSCWLHVLRKVKVEQRLSLFYLANDVIQYSKRKNYPFVESWAPALQKATPLVRDEKVRHKILRLFKIWNERSIYDETFLTDLSGLLTAHTKKSKQLSTADLIQEFQPSLLFSKIRKCKILEEDTDLKLKVLKECTIPVSDPDALSIVVKDRRNGDDLLLDLDDGIQKLEAYTKALELEIKERTEVINVLEVSEQFYDTQRGEAKVVCNAYRNFGSRVKSLKRKLEELLPTLPSPVPSPDVNAPSPSSGSDIDIPEDNKPVCYDSEKSFIGTDFVTAMNNANEKQAEIMKNVNQNYQNLDMGNSNYGMLAQTNYEDYSNGSDVNMISAGYYKNNSQLDLESPASPIHRHLNNDSYLYHPEGNPIEVISSSNNDNHSAFGVSSFLQNIITTNSTTPTPVPPVQAKIPGLESPTDNAREVFNFIESKVKVDDTGPVMWGDKPLTKYQSWPSPDITWNNTQETPVSPPAFEQESFSNPVEYVDSNIDNSRFSMSFNNVHRLTDVDHRLLNSKPNDSRTKFDQVATIPLPKHDIDDRIPMQNTMTNRNLISLTESPSVNDSWKVSDSDYRVAPLSLPSGVIDGVRSIKTPQDNIESVDMEMSDEESDSKHDDRGNGNRHRKSSFKDEEAMYKKTNQAPPQLLPPPNPWDMVNLSLDNTNEDNNSKNVSNKVEFDKMMSFLSNPPPTIEPPRMPEFPCFQIPRPPAANVKPFNDLRFPRPPDLSVSLGDPKMFQSRSDFPPPPPMPPANLTNRLSGGGFNHPFSFIQFSQPNSNSNPIFVNNMSQSPRKEFISTPGFQPSEPPPGFQPSAPAPSYESAEHSSKNNQFSRKNINNIEPIIKTRQFDKRLPESVAPFENIPEYSAKPIRSNLKEISLSDVLEKSISRTRDEEVYENRTDPQNNSSKDDQINDASLNSIAEDLFNEESTQNENVDDNDDLYNNIEETNLDQDGNNSKNDSGMMDANDKNDGVSFVPVDSKLVQNNHFNVHDTGGTQNISNTESERKTNDSKSPRKTPFQGVVPKLSKPSIAPPNFIEDDQRNPWPLMPIIDLSNENNSSENHPNADEDVDDEHTAAFTTQEDNLGDGRGDFNSCGMNNDFRPRLLNNFGSDRRFSSPAQSSMRFRGDAINRGRGRFMSPRPEFRPRMVGNNFSPNQDQMRRMLRPPFNLPSARGNFQNSPRLFKGRPGRPFRRGDSESRSQKLPSTCLSWSCFARV